MSKQTSGKLKTSPRLHQIGFWATVWWAASGLYVLIWFWQAKDLYVEISGSTPTASYISKWHSALADAYNNSGMLMALLITIIAIWIIIGVSWFKELKRQKISYKAALKDLFFTIR